MNMRKNKTESKVKMSFLLAVVLLSFFPYLTLADDSSLPKGAQPVVTSVEGILTYYVKQGDKVPKGDPLFFVRSNDWPIGKIKQLKQDIVYYKKTYDRNRRLAKTNAVSIQALDDSWHNYQDALNELEIAKQQTRSGFYTAPYDCKVDRLEYPPESGVGDGNPVIYIEKISSSELKK